MDLVNMGVLVVSITPSLFALAVCHFDRLVEASSTGTIILFAETCIRLLHPGVLCVECVFGLVV